MDEDWLDPSRCTFKYTVASFVAQTVLFFALQDFGSLGFSQDCPRKNNRELCSYSRPLRFVSLLLYLS